MAAKIKKGDTVIVLSGKDKGKEGAVLSVQPTKGKLVVAGVNVVKRHTRASQTNAGGIVEKELPVDVSNVAIKDPKDGKPTRVGFKVDGKTKVRIAKRSGTELN